MVTLDFFCPLKQHATETDEAYIERAQRWHIRTRGNLMAWKAKHREKLREYARRHYEAHRESITARARERYARDHQYREAAKERHKRWRKGMRGREWYKAYSKGRKESSHRYYVKHREDIIYRVTIYQLLHKGVIRAASKRYYQRHRMEIIQRGQLRRLRLREFWRRRTTVDKTIVNRWRNDNGE